MYRKVVPLLVCLISLSAFAQKTFLITNNDPFRRANSVSTYAIQADGSLVPVGEFTTGGNGGGGSGDPSGQGIGFTSTTRVVATADGRFVYATNAPDNTVSGFSIEPQTGMLTLVPGSPFATGGNACQGMGLASTPNSQFLFAMNTCSQDVTSFKINADGSLTVVGTRAGTGGEGEEVKTTGDGKVLAVSLSGFRAGTATFTIGTDGSLTPAPGSPFTGSSGFPGALEANCGGDQLFVLNDGSPSSVDVFAVAANGALSLGSQSSFTIPQPPGAEGEVSMYLSPDGKFLFVGDAGSFASSFAVATDGSLTSVSSFVPSPGTDFIGHVVTDPAGKFLYASTDFPSLAAYSIAANGAITLLSASPFSTPGFSALGSLAAYPPKTCSLTVQIKLRPEERRNEVVTVFAKSDEKLEVAILSTATFDAPAQVDRTSLTFGATGSEPSLDSCKKQARDVNSDGLADLICTFKVREAGFETGDTQAVLRGKTLTGTPIEGTAPVRVVP